MIGASQIISFGCTTLPSGAHSIAAFHSVEHLDTGGDRGIRVRRVHAQSDMRIVVRIPGNRPDRACV
jgi:hypothetical protein